jgi:FRG domain
METIGIQKIWTFSDNTACHVANNTAIRKGPGHRVNSYLELATKIAELQFMNRDHVLLFRGQSGDHKNVQHNTSLKPTLLRPTSGANADQGTLVARFEALQRAEAALVAAYHAAGFLGMDRLRRQRIVRWSILQHYEVCTTPLLDVSQSLRVAASFASLAETDTAYLYVIGVPNLSGAITASAEAGLQIVRLSSVCPPSAMRPHIQEGYLLGEYPEMAGYEQKENYFNYEIDFGRRLVAKFVFRPASFWKNDNFPKVAKTALYPPAKNDPLYKLALGVQKELGAGGG